MINAINDLRRRWWERQSEVAGRPVTAANDREFVTLSRCIQELCDTVDGVRPLPLNEASTKDLYAWAPRMVAIFDLMIQARGAKSTDNNNDLASIGYDLGEYADQAFLNDLYDLFKQLSNRGTK